jgi:hypothetical protein
MKVKALKVGFFGTLLRQVGEVFEIDNANQLGKWMEIIEDVVDVVEDVVDVLDDKEEAKQVDTTNKLTKSPTRRKSATKATPKPRNPKK